MTCFGRLGALRYHTSLNARMDTGLSTTGGGVTGTSTGSPGSNANGRSDHRRGSSSGRANRPEVITERPAPAPPAARSNHATVYSASRSSSIRRAIESLKLVVRSAKTTRRDEVIGWA